MKMNKQTTRNYTCKINMENWKTLFNQSQLHFGYGIDRSPALSRSQECSLPPNGNFTHAVLLHLFKATLPKTSTKIQNQLLLSNLHSYKFNNKIRHGTPLKSASCQLKCDWNNIKDNIISHTIYFSKYYSIIINNYSIGIHSFSKRLFYYPFNKKSNCPKTVSPNL